MAINHRNTAGQTKTERPNKKKTEISNTENTYHLLWAKNIPCLNARSSKKGKTTTAYRGKLVLVEMALLVASQPLNTRVVVY